MGRKRKAKIETGELLAKMCKAASERWSKDPSKPGIQIAHLPAEADLMSIETEAFDTTLGERRIASVAQSPGAPARWYAAIHRYRAPMGNDKYVQGKAVIGDDLDVVLETLALQILPEPLQREAQGELAAALGAQGPE